MTAKELTPLLGCMTVLLTGPAYADDGPSGVGRDGWGSGPLGLDWPGDGCNG